MSSEAHVRGAQKRGSAVSDKAFAHAVKDRKAVRVRLLEGDSIFVSYIIGLDDYHVALMDHELSLHLVHKTAPCITILDTTMDRDLHPNIEEIRTRTEPFRESVLRSHFNQAESAKEH